MTIKKEKKKKKRLTLVIQVKREKYLVHFSKFSSKMINLNSGIKELAGENLTFSNDILEI